MSTQDRTTALGGFRVVERPSADGRRIQGTGVVTAHTYPFRLPRREAGPDSGPAGKIPRFLICSITTLIASHDGWDPDTRTLSLGRGFQRLREEADLSGQGRVHTGSRDALEWWSHHPLVTQDGPMRMVEDYGWSTRMVDERWVRLTQEFVDASGRQTATVPFRAFSGTGRSTPATDLIVFAATECPPDHRLRVSFPTLALWFGLAGADGDSYNYNYARRWRPILQAANRAQSRWLFTMDDAEVSIRPVMAGEDCPTVRLSLA